MPVNEKAERSQQETAVFFCSLSLRTGRSTYAAGSASLRALLCAALTHALAGGVPADAWRAP